MKNDPAYVKYLIRFLTSTNGVFSEKLIPYHECNDTDWKDFAPTAKASKSKFESVRDSPNRGFFCIDWDDDAPNLIYGDWSEADYQSIEIVLVPCNYVHAEVGETDDYVREEC